jgi:hypothetical protein
MKTLTFLTFRVLDSCFEDIVWCIRALVKRLVHKWPSHESIVLGLRNMPKSVVCYSTLRRIQHVNGTDWGMLSVKTFVLHYHTNFEFLHHKPSEATKIHWNKEIDWNIGDAIKEIEKRIAFLLGIQVPTEGMRMISDEFLKRKSKVPNDKKPRRAESGNFQEVLFRNLQQHQTRQTTSEGAVHAGIVQGAGAGMLTTGGSAGLRTSAGLLLQEIEEETSPNHVR